MAILGSLIKTAIDIRDALSTEKPAIEAQKEVLLDLLDKAKETSFGLYYGFEKILESPDPQKAFAEAVPYFDYHQMEKMWWSRTHLSLPNITWPGVPDYLARSSGTTGKQSKRIPVTQEMIDAIQSAGIKQVGALANFDMPSDFFEKDILMLGSSTDLIRQGNFLEGEISGISAGNIPNWFKGFYKPEEEIALISDWDKKVELIAKNATQWDIGALSGIPSWIELMLKKIIDYHDLKTIHDIWPNLRAYATGGVAFKPYEKSFNQLLAQPITVIDTYLASEGFMAFQARPETTSMKLVTDNGIYFEFVPFKAEYIDEDGALIQGVPALTLEEVQEGVNYVLLISTVSGAWRYIIGDTICFTDVARAEIKITGRTKFFLNVVGAQLSVNKMEEALREMENKFDIKIPEFTVSAVKINNEYHHHWYLGSETTITGKEIAQALDAALQEANKNYGVARTKALKGVMVSVVPPQAFQDWQAEKKQKGGQVKMEKVMDEEKFKTWEAFLSERNYINP